MSATSTAQQDARVSAGVKRAAIAGLTVFGDPFDRLSWSGSTWSLFTELQLQRVLAEAASVDLSLAQKCLSALRNPSFDKRRLYLDVMKSQFSFALRSGNANSVLRGFRQPFNAVLQLSALFLPERVKGAVHCSYHDGNTAVSRRPEFSFMAAASDRVMRESWAYEQRFYKQMNLVFTMSEWLRDSMVQDFGVRPENVFAVGAGTNLSYEDELRQGSAHARERKRALLFVGTNFEFKGGPVTLDVFRKLKKDFADLELWIVGCEPQINEPGVTVFGTLRKTDPAQESKLRELYETASVFVLPTLYDAFGIVFVEALFHGLPCVGSNRCAVPEIIGEGVGGFVADPTDAGALAGAVQQLLSDHKLAREMGERGRERAMSRYGWGQVCRAMVEQIEKRL
jgi:glycosyltransferase involved in cell wall biosynthesis